jgi:hypothetical protein
MSEIKQDAGDWLRHENHGAVYFGVGQQWENRMTER